MSDNFNFFDELRRAGAQFGTPSAFDVATEEDVDAFNDAFEEVYTTFLSRREREGSHLTKGTLSLVEGLRGGAQKIVDAYADKRPVKRDVLIGAVICGLEILSLKRTTGEQRGR